MKEQESIEPLIQKTEVPDVSIKAYYRDMSAQVIDLIKRPVDADDEIERSVCPDESMVDAQPRSAGSSSDARLPVEDQSGGRRTDQYASS